jgi:hypothetical protein
MERFPDGSYRSELRPTWHSRATDRGPIPVRVIEYTRPTVRDAEPVYRLVTTLLDPSAAPAELAALYHERGEVEGAFDELKTHLKGAQAVLRSKTPEPVRQEAYGLLLAHDPVRGLLHEATVAAPGGPRDPDTLSFVHGVRVLRRTVPRLAAVPPSGSGDHVAAAPRRPPRRIARGARELQPRVQRAAVRQAQDDALPRPPAATTTESPRRLHRPHPQVNSVAADCRCSTRVPPRRHPRPITSAHISAARLGPAELGAAEVIGFGAGPALPRGSPPASVPSAHAFSPLRQP